MLARQSRHIARDHGVQAPGLRVDPQLLQSGASVREGLIDPDSPEWKPKFQAAQRKVAAKCGVDDDCRYWYEHCPGLTITEMEVFVRRYLARAEARGLELVVILDYYQEMGWDDLHGVQNETQGLNILATKLKEMAEDYGIYLIVFAQEADDDADRKGRTTPYMAKKIVKRAQAHFRILRGPDDKLAVAAVDLPMDSGKRDEHGRVIPDLDGLGRDMYWHRKDEPNAYSRVHLCRGNNVGTGVQYLLIANGYFFVQEAMPPE